MWSSIVLSFESRVLQRSFHHWVPHGSQAAIGSCPRPVLRFGRYRVDHPSTVSKRRRVPFLKGVCHGDGLTSPQIEEMAQRGIYWVPTIAVGAYVANGRQGNWPKIVETEKTAFQLALTKGVKIAFGTDAGGFDWKKLNEAKEFEYYVNRIPHWRVLFFEISLRTPITMQMAARLILY